MAGDEEARARTTLVAMQSRISQGPFAALGVQAGANAEQIRFAFLELTKQYHPARFGRMTPELQRMSNEVFLGIKGAHDALQKLVGSTGRGPGAPSTPPHAGVTGPHPVRASSPPPQQQTQKFQPPPARAVTPAFGVRLSSPRPGTPPYPSATDPATQRGVLAPRPALPSPDERLELQRALDLMAASNWSGARTAMTSLAARVPTSKQYRALLCYTRGREAQAAGKGEEAVMEMQRALQLDPELGQAKSALADLLRRR